ncbi:hypothetical protein WJX82_010840 [Trebouxia sp. C0006]
MDVLVYNRTKEYLPDVQDQSWSLGKGGCFTTVERYFEKKSKGVFAVKKMPKLYKLEYGDLFQNEARALSHAHIFGVPRVIKYIEGARTTDDICLILELVRGKTLSTHMCSRPAHAQPGWEQQTLGVAVQLLDTLKHLHTKANVCHLDLTITNVMLQDDRSNGWDVLRLIDFGFAQVFNEDMLYIGVRTRDVKPTEELHPTWEEYESIIECHKVWENACEVAMREGRPVKHPLIDRVRECSSNPDAAADFFRLLFQFKSEKRLLHDAACHSYLSATFDRMKAAPSISMELSSDVVQDDETSGNDDGNGNDAGSSSAEQSTELDPCLLPKPDFIPSQQPTDKDAGAHDPCRGVIGRAYYAAGAVCGVALGLRKLWS